MKKSKKKVASTMDERAQLISGESSARGYWVAMLGIFVTIMVASKTHSIELVQSLLIITFFGSMCLVLVHSVSRNGHPWLLDKKLEKKMLRLSWVMCFFGIFINVLTTKKIQGQKSALKRTKNLAQLKAAHAILNST